MIRFVSLLSVLATSTMVSGIMFNLEPNNRKCLKEEIHKEVLVTGKDPTFQNLSLRTVDLSRLSVATDSKLATSAGLIHMDH